MSVLARLRGLLGAAAIIAGLLSPIALAGQADAAVVCDNVSFITHGSLTFKMPTRGKDTGNVNCFLAPNDHSAAVSILQIHLNDCYWSGSNTRGHASAFSPALTTEGIYGPRTTAALTAAQNTIPGISHDGVYGPQTRANILFFADDGLLGRCARFGL
jgi:hypothetical protein